MVILNYRSLSTVVSCLCSRFLSDGYFWTISYTSVTVTRHMMNDIIMLRESVMLQPHSTIPGSGCRHGLLVGGGSDLFESFAVIFGSVPYTRLS